MLYSRVRQHLPLGFLFQHYLVSFHFCQEEPGRDPSLACSTELAQRRFAYINSDRFHVRMHFAALSTASAALLFIAASPPL